MTRAPTNATAAGRAYLAIQKKARAEGRASDELLQLFALEAFLDRLSTSPAARDVVLQGGVLLAAYELRRPTRDVDLSARNLRNSVESTVALVAGIVSQERDDTALQRGTATTRWRDFADIYLLSRHHAVQAEDLSTAIVRVAEFRRTALIALRDALDGYAALAQTRWAAWLRRQRLLDRLPMEFAEVLSDVQRFR